MKFKLGLFLLLILLLTASYQQCGLPTASVTLQAVWGWDCEETYNIGDRCWLGTYPNGEYRNWESLQNNNKGHRPWDGQQAVSPEWWASQ